MFRFASMCLFTLFFSVLGSPLHADTPNRDPSFAAPQGYAKVLTLLGGSTYLSARPRRLLIDEQGRHYLVGTGQTAIGVSPAQSAVSVVSLTAEGQLNTSFFGTGVRAFKMDRGGVITDSVVEDAVWINGLGMLIVGRYVGAPGGFAVMLQSNGLPNPLFGFNGSMFIPDMEPRAVARSTLSNDGIYIAGTRNGGASRTDIRVRAYTLVGIVRPEWGVNGLQDWAYVDAQNRSDYDEMPTSIAANFFGHVAVVGNTRRPGSNQQLGVIAIFDALGPRGSRAESVAPCEVGAAAEYDITRIYIPPNDFGNRMYMAIRTTIDNASCPSVARQSMGVVELDPGPFTTTLRGQTSTRASCCGGDGVGLAVTDVVRDDAGFYYLSFSTNLPGGVSRGHLVRFAPASPSVAPDPSFGENGFGTYNLDSPSADATLTAIAVDAQNRLVAAGGYTSDILGNPLNVDHWAFRLRSDAVFANGFE